MVVAMVNCDYCNTQFDKRPSLIKAHKNHFCSIDCKSLYNKKITLEKINDENIKINKDTLMVYINCKECNKEELIYPSKYLNIVNDKSNFFCSVKCRNKYDSKEFAGKGNPNYKTGEHDNICENCQKVYSVRNYRKDTTRYCSRECKDEYLRNHPEISINLLLMQNRRFTLPERIVNDYLNELKYDFIPQYTVDNRYVADFYIPSLNLIIEVQGDYFHANPDFYGDGKNKKPLTKRQKQKRITDKYKLDYYISKNYNTLYLWENDIKNNNFKQIFKTYILESVTTKRLCSNV